MDSTVITERVKRALKGDASVFSEIGADESHTSSAAAIVAVIGFASGLLRGLFTANVSVFSGAIQGVFGAFIGWIIGTALFYALGKMFGGSGDFQGLLRGNAYAAVPSAVSGIPFIGWLISLWGVYLFILNVRENMSLTMGAAVAVVLIPMAILFLLVIVLVVFVLAAVSGLS